MLRINMKKAAAAALVNMMVLTSVLPVYGADTETRTGDPDLYFEALQNEISEDIQLVTVRKGDYIVNSSCRARIEYDSITYVFNNNSTGNAVVDDILVSTGSEVKRGDPIATVNVSIDEKSVEELETEIESYEEMIENYSHTNNELLKRYQDLALNSATATDRKVAQLLYDRLSVSFQKELSSREDRLEAMKSELSSYHNIIAAQTIKSPATGRVGNIVRRSWGDSIGYYGYICSVYDTEHIRLRVTSGGTDLTFNQKVSIVQGNNSGKTVPGRVTTCLSSALSSNLVGSVNYIEVLGDTSGFGLDEEVTVRYEVQHVKNALLVSRDAVKSDDGGYYVFAYKDGRKYKQYVVSGGFNSSDHWIVKGVEEGDQIVLR